MTRYLLGMATLSPDQRNDYYLMEAARVGIHKPILAALYRAHGQPQLADGELGLGIYPINRVGLDHVNTFPGQVQYAANTVRSLTDSLTAEGWQGSDLWNASEGRYSDRLLRTLAEGYRPPASDTSAALLEANDFNTLKEAYLADMVYDYDANQLPQNLANLDQALLAFAEAVPPHYRRLGFQRQALLEAVRIWRKLDSHGAVLKALELPEPASPADEIALDQALVNVMEGVVRHYAGYPYQREALLRLVQLWRQMDSREAAIQWLESYDPQVHDTNLQSIDPALIAFVQRLPGQYRGQGDQRFALTEAYRLWHHLDSRAAALESLGIDPRRIVQQADDKAALMATATQIDQGLLAFIKSVPQTYQETDSQRQALIHLVQIWRRLEGRLPTLQALFDDLRRLERAQRNAVEAMPAPEVLPLPPRPDRWTPETIQLAAAIIANGNFTWAEATHGGTRMPPNQATVDAIVRIAELAQQACDRIGRPFKIIRWYQPAEDTTRVGDASQSRHIIGDAIDVYCDGLSGNQIYWALDPWWPGGLGRYRRFPYLVHLDARGHRTRWIH